MTRHGVIRPADPSRDLDDLLGLERACFGDDAWSRAGLASALAPPGLALVCHADDTRVDGMALWSRVADEAELLRLAVDPAAQRRGIARALLAASLAQLGALGTARVLLEVRADNHAALALYRATGWQVDGQRPGYYRDGTAAVLLSRLVAESDDCSPQSLVPEPPGRIPSR